MVGRAGSDPVAGGCGGAVACAPADPARASVTKNEEKELGFRNIACVR
jgi:hypothetical protein